MSQPQIPFNFIPTDPSLTDALNLLKKDILLSLFAHHIGTIQTFNAEKQTCTASINYTKTYFKYAPATGAYNPYQVTYPLIADCPVIFLGGGSGSLTFPVSQGDECILLFNDRDIDNWFQGGSGAPVSTPRLHSISDAIALVGVRSLANVLDGFDTSSVVLQNGTTKVSIGESLITLANATTTLNTLLQNLISALESLKIDVAGVGLSQGTVDATSVAALSSIASQIGGLLG